MTLSGSGKGDIKLSVIILNHDSGNLLSDCLESLFNDGIDFNYEVIIVDNASKDYSIDMAVKSWGNRLRIIRNSENLGFAVGNNIGIKASFGEFVCLLNPDTIIYKGTFRTLVSFLDNNDRAGFVGPKVLNRDGSFQASAKRMIPTPFDAISRLLLLSKIFKNNKTFSRYNLSYTDIDTAQRVDASTGCCMVARKKMLDQIGLLDENFFIYCEDVDWFLRAKEAGWEVWYLPQAVIKHLNAYSMSFRRQKAVSDFHRSIAYFYRKHYANKYPVIFNLLIYAAIFIRKHSLILIKNARGWK